MVHFKFPVAYNGEAVYEFSPRSSTTDETVVLMGKNVTRSKSHVNLGLNVKEYYRIKDEEKEK